MGESLRSRLLSLGFNFFPAYRGTGGRITHLAADWREPRIKLPLNFRTRNYVGTFFSSVLISPPIDTRNVLPVLPFPPT
jgi:hypothetical protein